MNRIALVISNVVIVSMTPQMSVAQNEVPLRSCTMYPKSSWISDSTLSIPGWIDDLDPPSEYEMPGIPITLGEDTRITRIFGIGQVPGPDPVAYAAMVNVFNVPGSNFGDQAPMGDVLQISSVIMPVTPFGPGGLAIPTYAAEIDLEAQDQEFVLEAGSYIVSVVAVQTALPWTWLEAPVDLGSDWLTAHYMVPPGPSAVLVSSNPSFEYGTTAIDIFGVPCDHPADFDADCDVDGDDFAEFEACMSGPTIPVAAGCEAKDLDNDGDADMADFAILQRSHL